MSVKEVNKLLVIFEERIITTQYCALLYQIVISVRIVCFFLWWFWCRRGILWGAWGSTTNAPRMRRSLVNAAGAIIFFQWRDKLNSWYESGYYLILFFRNQVYIVASDVLAEADNSTGQTMYGPWGLSFHKLKTENTDTPFNQLSICNYISWQSYNALLQNG